MLVAANTKKINVHVYENKIVECTYYHWKKIFWVKGKSSDLTDWMLRDKKTVICLTQMKNLCDLRKKDMGKENSNDSWHWKLILKYRFLRNTAIRLFWYSDIVI